MKKLGLRTIFSGVLLVSFLFGCNDKKDQSLVLLTPDEQKAKFEEVAVQFMDQVVPGEYLAPAQSMMECSAIMDVNPPTMSLAKVAAPLKRISSAIGSGLITRSDMLAENADILPLIGHTGVYVLGSNGQWSYTANPSKLEFQMRGSNNQAYVLTIVQSSTIKTIQFRGSMMQLPKEMSLVLKREGVQQVALGLTINDLNDQTFVFDTQTSLTVGSMTASVTEKISSVGGNLKMLLSRNGSNLLTILMALDASGLPDVVNYSQLNNFAASISIMDQLFMNVAVLKIGGMMNEMMAVTQDHNNGVISSSLAAERITSVFDNHLVAYWNFDNSLEPQGQMRMIYTAMKGEMVPMPVVMFVADGSQYSIDSYFTQDRFSTVLNRLGVLVNSFMQTFGRY